MTSSRTEQRGRRRILIEATFATADPQQKGRMGPGSPIYSVKRRGNR